MKTVRAFKILKSLKDSWPAVYLNYREIDISGGGGRGVLGVIHRLKKRKGNRQKADKIAL